MSDKQEPYAWAVSGSSRLYDEYEAEATAKRCGGSTEAFPLYRHAAPEGWRPIETAPAGEWVLVEIDGKAVTEGVFAKEFGGWDWRATDDEADDAVVTGWMPKPVARNAPKEG